jgi:hypothetical protein
MIKFHELGSTRLTDSGEPLRFSIFHSSLVVMIKCSELEEYAFKNLLGSQWQDLLSDIILFIYGLFNNALSSSEYTAPNDKVTND